MTEEQLRALFSKPSWTAAEKEQLLSYLNQDDPSKLEQVMKDLFLSNEAGPGLQHDESVRLLQAIREKIGPSAPARRIAFKRPLLVAASFIGVVLVLGIGYKLFTTTEKAPVTAESPVENARPILPGSDGAILTLADGSEIVLDSAANGLLPAGSRPMIDRSAGRIAYLGNQGDRVEYNTLTTPRSRQYQLVLSDGTRLWLNAQSSVRFPTRFTGTERRVSINGEAYFEVQKNAAMPFHVEANGTEVTVLGTHFNVNAYNDQPLVKTTLLEGSVLLSKGRQKLLLKPGQAGQVATNGNDLSLVENADTDEAIAWKEGRFLFNHTDIEAIMTQLSRWYDVEIEYRGSVPKRSFTGDLSRTTQLSDFLQVLEESKIHFSIDNRKIIVSP